MTEKKIKHYSCANCEHNWLCPNGEGRYGTLCDAFSPVDADGRFAPAGWYGGRERSRMRRTDFGEWREYCDEYGDGGLKD